MSQTYSDVDASADPAEAVAWQERMSRWPAVAAYKARTHEPLGGADPVLDDLIKGVCGSVRLVRSGPCVARGVALGHALARWTP